MKHAVFAQRRDEARSSHCVVWLLLLYFIFTGVGFLPTQPQLWLCCAHSCVSYGKPNSRVSGCDSFDQVGLLLSNLSSTDNLKSRLQWVQLPHISFVHHLLVACQPRLLLLFFDSNVDNFPFSIVVFNKLSASILVFNKLSTFHCSCQQA